MQKMAGVQCSPLPVSGNAPPVSPVCRTPIASIPAPVATIAESPDWSHDPMRYPVTITPPAGIPESLNLTPEEEPEIQHVSVSCLFQQI